MKPTTTTKSSTIAAAFRARPITDFDITLIADLLALLTSADKNERETGKNRVRTLVIRGLVIHGKEAQAAAPLRPRTIGQLCTAHQGLNSLYLDNEITPHPDVKAYCIDATDIIPTGSTGAFNTDSEYAFVAPNIQLRG